MKININFTFNGCLTNENLWFVLSIYALCLYILEFSCMQISICEFLISSIGRPFSYIICQNHKKPCATQYCLMYIVMQLCKWKINYYKKFQYRMLLIAFPPVKLCFLASLSPQMDAPVFKLLSIIVPTIMMLYLFFFEEL